MMSVKREVAVVEQKDETQDEMSFFDHLDELRKHLLRSVVSIIIAGTVLFLLKDFVFDKIIFAVKSADFPSYRFSCWLSESLGMGERLCMEPFNFTLITTQLGEAFMLHLKVSVIGGFIVAFPYVFYEFWRFIKPGLLVEEQKSTKGVVFVCSLLFMTGVLFGYYIVSPFAVNFLAGYDINNVNNNVTISSFVNYMIMFTLPTGLAFELPLVVYYLAKVGLVTPEFMRQYRRHAFVILLIAAAIITPPDVVTQILIGTPLYLLYELSIYIAARETKKREAAMA